MNSVSLFGRIGRDPEVRTLETGKSVTNFTLATSERYKDKNGEKKEKVEWHNLVAWSPFAEIVAKYVKKGDQFLCTGKLQTRSWEKDGITRYTTEVVLTGLSLIGGGRSNGTNNQEPTGGSADNGGSFSGEDPHGDLPF